MRSRWTVSHSGWTSLSWLGGTGCAKTSHADDFDYARRTALQGVLGVRGGSPSRRMGWRMRLALSQCRWVTVAALGSAVVQDGVDYMYRDPYVLL